jgi:hypothetical protein
VFFFLDRKGQLLWIRLDVYLDNKYIYICIGKLQIEVEDVKNAKQNQLSVASGCFESTSTVNGTLENKKVISPAGASVT